MPKVRGHHGSRKRRYKGEAVKRRYARAKARAEIRDIQRLLQLLEDEGLID
jgi:hypothetical protein